MKAIISLISLITIFLTSCDDKPTSLGSETVSSSRKSEAAVTETPVVTEIPVQKKCYPPIPNIDPRDMPPELELDCSTQRPVNPEAFHDFRMRLNRAVAEAQAEIAARQQAAAESGDDRMLGIQQRQDGCTYRYPGVFSAQNPLGGMCADSPEQISAYQRNQAAGQNARDAREIQQIHDDGVSRCRRLCVGSSNYASCAASCM